METVLTKQDILELLKEQAIEFDRRLTKEAEERKKEAEERKKEAEERKKEAEERKKEAEERKKEAEERWKKEAEEREESKKLFEERLKREEEERIKSKEEFDKKIGKIAGVLGGFVEGMVEPKILEMFHERGIFLTEVMRNVLIHNKETLKLEAEIDLLLINDTYSVAVEVKTKLTSEHVQEHLDRLNRLKNNPIRSIKGTNLLGAVAGMRVEENAETFAIKKGLYVLKQKGEIVEIANDDNFKPREWEIE